jgi:hypothetical protein
MSNARGPLSCFSLVLASMLLGGCASVAPWERGYLAKPQMAMEPNPEQRSLRVHAYRSRESAAGWGEATGGGGCGCY